MTPELTARLGVRREIWAAEDLKRRLGLAGLNLGRVETGFGMADPKPAAMPLPPTPELLSYAERAVQAAISAVAGLTEDDLHQVAHVAPERSDWMEPGSEDRDLVFGWVLDYLAHDAEHLGAMRTLAHITIDA
jgi:hypothetical protein